MTKIRNKCSGLFVKGNSLWPVLNCVAICIARPKKHTKQAFFFQFQV